MTCYKEGGCGVYENRACNECPASKPEYATQKEKPAQWDNLLGEWTLGELQKYCRRTSCNCCRFKTDGKICDFYESPSLWNLTDPPRFTKEEVADARAIIRLLQCNKMLGIVRASTSDELFLSSGGISQDIILNPQLFPSIRSGKFATLSEIIGDATK